MRRLVCLFVLVFATLGFVPMAFSQATTQYFSQMVTGGQANNYYVSTFSLVNINDVDAPFQVFWGSQKGPVPALDVEVSGFPDKFVGQSGVSGWVLAHSSLTITVTSTSLDWVVGWAGIMRRNGPDSVQVSLQYSYYVDGSLVGQATVDPIEATTFFGFYAESSSGLGQDSIETGFAIANPAPVPANIKMILRDDWGREIGSCQPSTPIPAFGQIAAFVKEVCRLTNPFKGLVEVRADIPVALTTLRATVSKKDGKTTFSGQKEASKKQ